MTDKEQTSHFANDLDLLVERYRNEYDMSYAQIVGTLHMKAHLLCNEAEGKYGEDDDDGEET